MSEKDEETTFKGALNQAARTIKGVIGDGVGIPVRLQQFVAEQKNLCIPLEMPRKSVSHDKIVKWHWWTKEYQHFRNTKGEIQYWSGSRPHQGASNVIIDELANFTVETKTQNWSCDLADIAGLSASKAKLEQFLTLDEFAETEFPEMLHPLSEDSISALLNKYFYSTEYSGLTDNQKRSGMFTRYMWDEGRIFLINSVDMHPVIAARYIAKRIKKEIPIYGTLNTYHINVNAAQSLIKRFDVFTMSPQPYIPFLEAMGMFGAPFGVYGLPRGLLFNNGNKTLTYNGAPIGVETLEERETRDIRLVLLPRDDERAVQVSAVLRQAGLFDAGRFILSAAHQQASI